MEKNKIQCFIFFQVGKPYYQCVYYFCLFSRPDSVQDLRDMIRTSAVEIIFSSHTRNDGQYEVKKEKV